MSLLSERLLLGTRAVHAATHDPEQIRNCAIGIPAGLHLTQEAHRRTVQIGFGKTHCAESREYDLVVDAVFTPKKAIFIGVSDNCVSIRRFHFGHHCHLPSPSLRRMYGCIRRATPNRSKRNAALSGGVR